MDIENELPESKRWHNYKDIGCLVNHLLHIEIENLPIKT